MTDYGSASLVERLARHLTVQDADGSAHDWRARIDEAVGILAILKVPDARMQEAGDIPTWEAMIDAALVERWALGTDNGPAAPPPGGTDEEGDVPFSPSPSLVEDTNSWVQVREGPDPQ